MPQTIIPIRKRLAAQIEAVFGHYLRMLDDEFLFASAAQVPQVTTIFDLTQGKPLEFGQETITLPGLLALVAYRYGFESLQRVGHGGYAVVMGHDVPLTDGVMWRRVLRLVPDHHVNDLTQGGRTFDVQLDDYNEPIRDAAFPLLLSDLFLLPRHTTKLAFQDVNGQVMLAAGKPAVLHCQLLPQVMPMNASGLNISMAEQAGDLLEAALATLGVSVADAHGGNGGVLLDQDGQPLLFRQTLPSGEIRERYIPVVLDYGYYSEIGPKTLASVLLRNGVTQPMVQAMLNYHGLALTYDGTPASLANIIAQSGLQRRDFGRLLYVVQPAVLSPNIWIDYSESHWRTTKERSYPPLQDQARLNTIYPAYDEILFPQRIEEYSFTLK